MPRAFLALLALFTVAALVAPLPAGAQESPPEPQESWMIHLDGGDGELRYLPSTFAVVPGGTVQLMVFGNGHGRYSITVEEHPELEAEVDTDREGFVHAAEFQAPLKEGSYVIFDRHHPDTRGTLIVAAKGNGTAAAGASDADAPPVVGVGNGYDTTFYPARLEVEAGSSFTFTNNASEIVHTFTSADAGLDTGTVRPGESQTLVAPSEPGEYPFVCTFHEGSGMTGVLVVRPAAAQAQAPSPASSSTGVPPSESTDEHGHEGGQAVPFVGAAVLVLGVAGAAALVARRRRKA